MIGTAVCTIQLVPTVRGARASNHSIPQPPTNHSYTKQRQTLHYIPHQHPTHPSPTLVHTLNEIKEINRQKAAAAAHSLVVVLAVVSMNVVVVCMVYVCMYVLDGRRLYFSVCLIIPWHLPLRGLSVWLCVYTSVESSSTPAPNIKQYKIKQPILSKKKAEMRRERFEGARNIYALPSASSAATTATATTTI